MDLKYNGPTAEVKHKSTLLLVHGGPNQERFVSRLDGELYVSDL